jgi:hypothetical protein
LSLRGIPKRRWLLVGALVFGLWVVYNLFGKPHYIAYESLPTNSVFFPLFVASYTPEITILSLFAAAALVVAWWLTDTNIPKHTVFMLMVVPMMSLCACCMCVTYKDDEIDIFDLNHTLQVRQSITANGHVYQFVLRQGLYGFSGGIVYECDATGLICRAVLSRGWGTESQYNTSRFPELHIENDENVIRMMFADEVLAEYVFDGE